jgi:acyl-homoserine lactone synthase
MILVERGSAVATDCAQLGAMFRARKEVFVDLLKWDVPVLEGQYEIDGYDDEHAHYVIVTDLAGAHLGSARLLKTTGPHILANLFPMLCNGELPRGPQVLEITRFCLDRHQNSLQRRATRNQLVSALVAFALERDIRTYTGVAEISWLQQILAFGWDCRPLGAPQHFDCGWLGALAIEINPDTPARLHQNSIWSPEMLSAAEFAQAA